MSFNIWVNFRLEPVSTSTSASSIQNFKDGCSDIWTVSLNLNHVQKSARQIYSSKIEFKSQILSNCVFLTWKFFKNSFNFGIFNKNKPTWAWKEENLPVLSNSEEPNQKLFHPLTPVRGRIHPDMSRLLSSNKVFGK